MRRERRKELRRHALRFAGQCLMRLPDAYEDHEELTVDEDEWVRDCVRKIGERLFRLGGGHDA